MSWFGLFGLSWNYIPLLVFQFQSVKVNLWFWAGTIQFSSRTQYVSFNSPSAMRCTSVSEEHNVVLPIISTFTNKRVYYTILQMIKTWVLKSIPDPQPPILHIAIHHAYFSIQRMKILNQVNLKLVATNGGFAKNMVFLTPASKHLLIQYHYIRRILKLITVKTCLPCWIKKYAEFVRLLQVSGIFLFCYFSFSGWAGLFSIVPSLPIYVATVQSVKRGINELVLFLSQAFVCLSGHLPFVFLLPINKFNIKDRLIWISLL